MRILVTGGAGYIGAVLVPELLGDGHRVTVLDLMLFGATPLAKVASHPDLRVVKADIRSAAAVQGVLSEGHDAVVHLAAISNDPSAELDPRVTKTVNGEATAQLMRLARSSGVRRFLYASSASVYGIKETDNVTEDLAPAPLTLYARCKIEGEHVLNSLVGPDFVGVSVRSATVCGYSPRLRLDLTINLLTDQALRERRIRVFGGTQMRPNIHVRDLTAFYRRLLAADATLVNGQAFNVSLCNSTVLGLAEMIRDQVRSTIPIDVEPTEDIRSYHLSPRRAEEELGFTPRYGLKDAVAELAAHYREGLEPAAADDWYRNVRWMRRHPERWRQ